MAGVGEPYLLIPAGASPHSYALKPSDARALEQAQLAIWVGPNNESGLARSLEQARPGREVLTLGTAAGMTILPARAGGAFEKHLHPTPPGHAGDEHEGHNHDHTEGHAQHEQHDHDHGGGHEHEHEHEHAAGQSVQRQDGHLWLAPANGLRAAELIAEALARLDPPHAARYRENLGRFRAEIDTVMAELTPKLATLQGKPFLVFHDAYQYFEHSFALPAAGSVQVNPGQPPSAQRLAELRQRIRDERIVCVFAEPQFPPKLVDTLIEGTPARKGVLDPLGHALPAGPAGYPALLRQLGSQLGECLGRAG